MWPPWVAQASTQRMYSAPEVSVHPVVAQALSQTASISIAGVEHKLLDFFLFFTPVVGEV